jgi:hypothetical protein
MPIMMVCMMLLELVDLKIQIMMVADYLDLDSDNDGIYDLVESGNAIDANSDEL